MMDLTGYTLTELLDGYADAVAGESRRDHGDLYCGVDKFRAAIDAEIKQIMNHEEQALNKIETLKSAVRFAPSSAHWSTVLTDLLGPESREGISALERQLTGAYAVVKEVARLKQRLAQKHAEQEELERHAEALADALAELRSLPAIPLKDFEKSGRVLFPYIDFRDKKEDA